MPTLPRHFPLVSFDTELLSLIISGPLLIDFLYYMIDSDYPPSVRVLWSHYILMKYFRFTDEMRHLLAVTIVPPIAELLETSPVSYKLPEVKSSAGLELNAEYESLLSLFSLKVCWHSLSCLLNLFFSCPWLQETERRWHWRGKPFKIAYFTNLCST